METKIYDPEEECKDVISRLKDICKLKNMSTNELATKAGLSISAVSYVLNCRTKPNLSTLFMLCNALDIPIGEVLKKSPGMEGLSDEEKELLFHYRHLPLEKQRLFWIYLTMLCQFNGNIKDIVRKEVRSKKSSVNSRK